jgi:hypothetical protein
MHHGLQDLLGEVARLRVECDYLTRYLDDLAALASHRAHLSERQHDDITATTGRYGATAKDHLEMATDSLRAWYEVVAGIEQTHEI